MAATVPGFKHREPRDQRHRGSRGTDTGPRHPCCPTSLQHPRCLLLGGAALPPRSLVAEPLCSLHRVCSGTDGDPGRGGKVPGPRCPHSRLCPLSQRWPPAALVTSVPGRGQGAQARALSNRPGLAAEGWSPSRTKASSQDHPATAARPPSFKRERSLAHTVPPPSLPAWGGLSRMTWLP